MMQVHSSLRSLINRVTQIQKKLVESLLLPKNNHISYFVAQLDHFSSLPMSRTPFD